MKFYTAGLMNEKPVFRLLPGRKASYYIAYGKDTDLIMMWIEDMYRRGRSYPCFIKDGDSMYCFAQKIVPDSDQINQELIERWDQLITPENIGSDFLVESLTEKEFFAKVNELQE